MPRGFAVNANVAVVLPMMLHTDEATAIDRGIDGAHFFGYSLGHYEHICESIELFASEVLPRFAEGRTGREAAKADRLADAVDRALGRRAPRRALPAPYEVNEDAELAAAPRTGQRPLRELARERPLRELAADATCAVRAALRGRLEAGTRRTVAAASDARIEQLMGGVTAQRAVFGLMASRFDANRAAGFDGSIVFDLGASDGTRRSWAIDVSQGRARARPGGAGEAALTRRLPRADFIRVSASAASFYPLNADGRMLIEGDLALAGRLAEIFGGRSVY